MNEDMMMDYYYESKSVEAWTDFFYSPAYQSWDEIPTLSDFLGD